MSETQKPPQRRRRLIIDKPFQYRLVALLLAIWGGNSLFAGLLYFFYQQHIERFYQLIPRAGQMPLLPSASLFPVTIGFFVAFGLATVAIVGVYLSNQIAGPIYRVKMCLNRMSEGDVSFELRFRDRDFLVDFPDYFNRMLRTLQEEGAKDVEVLRDIELKLEQPKVARELVKALRETKETKFKLEPKVEREEFLQPAL